LNWNGGFVVVGGGMVARVRFCEGARRPMLGMTTAGQEEGTTDDPAKCRHVDIRSPRVETSGRIMGIARSVAVATAFVCTIAQVFAAEQKYGPRVTDTEIKIGQTMPYSGPASAYSTVGVAQAAYFRMLNENGGINGRKINFNLISLDDAYSPPKTVEQIRRLSNQVPMILQSLGTAPNAAIQKYLNQKKIPHLFVSSGASRFNDPANFSYTTRWSPNYASKARVYLTVSIS
jgi:branched-chain amino acid transport system substrate-binding protein